MRKLSWVAVRTVALVGTLLAASAAWAHTTEGEASFGTPVLLPGHINEVAIDEVRRFVYAANFSAGRVEVISMATNQRIGSFSTSPQPAGTSSIAISPNGRWLVATSQSVLSSTPQQSSVTIVDLNDTGNPRHVSFPDEQPLAVAFQWNNQAVIITENRLLEFNPVTEESKLLYDFVVGAGPVELPVLPPSLPREILTANLTASADGRWIFGMAFDQPDLVPHFVFSYEVADPVGTLRFRIARGNEEGGGGLVNQPIFNQVSASPDGSYFMAGQLLFSNELQVVADTPEADTLTDDEFIGGTGFNFASGKIYASFGNFSDFFDTEVGDNHPRRGILHVMDEDNLFVSQRVRLAERIYGRIASSQDGSYAYAVSESGLLYLPITNLSGLPQLEIRSDDRSLVYQFGFCEQSPITKTMRIDTPPGGAPASFTLSTDLVTASGQPAVLFEPHQGVTPSNVQVTVDPALLGPMHGTTTIPVRVETNAVNVAESPLVISNLRDVDQRGSLHAVPGHLIQVLGDKVRDRFYVLDARNFKVLVFDSNTMTKIAELRTGNSPTAMTLSQDSRHLAVANSRAEYVSIFELDNLTPEESAYIPWQELAGRYPYAIVADGSRFMLASDWATVRSGEPFGASQLHWLTLPERAFETPETLGIYANTFLPLESFPGELGLKPSANGDYVLITQTPGREGSNVFLYESATRRLVITRWLPSGNAIEGSLGAGADFYTAGRYLFNGSAVPIGAFNDDAIGNESSGFTLAADGTGVRTIKPTSSVDTGVIQKLDPRNPLKVLASARMVDPPPARLPGHFFSSTLTTLRDGRFISTSSAGIVELPAAFESGLGKPRIEAITSGADFSPNVATGGLISIFGDRFSAQGAQANATPLPTTLNQACVSVDGEALPLLYVGPNQINAQLTYNVGGDVAFQVHTASGISDVFTKNVQAAAPAIFGVGGPNNTRFPAIFREDNTLATLSNPIRPNESFVIYLTGLGGVNPFAVAGNPASADLLSETVVAPTVTIGGASAEVTYSGLTPGYAGLYQINARAAGYTPAGTQQTLEVAIGSESTTVKVRIVQN